MEKEGVQDFGPGINNWRVWKNHKSLIEYDGRGEGQEKNVRIKMGTWKGKEKAEGRKN